MASENDETNHVKRHDDFTNPFIAFRRFADEQMSNLMKGIFGISSSWNYSNSPSDRAFQDYQAWLQEARASQGSPDREAEEAGHIMDVFSRACKDSSYEEHNQNSQDGDRALRCPYRPDNQEPPKHQDNDPYGPADPTPILIALMSPSIRQLLCSPYSPHKLAQDEDLGDRGIRWKEAFDDLLAVQNGENTNNARERCEKETGSDWFRQMICKTIGAIDKPFTGPIEVLKRDSGLSAQWRTNRDSDCDTRGKERDANVDDAEDDDDGNENDNDDDDYRKPVTELDLYEHFFGKQYPPSTDESPSKSTSKYQSESQSFAHLQQDSAPPNEISTKPSLLSTLTTTERTTLPDGTTTTKVVLKKRFSDGREESSETMHTQNPTPKIEYQPPRQVAKEEGNSQQSSGSDDKAKKGKGWFWS
ncbi:hypothetical protein ACLMJK_001260 [Lecanora helva]